MTTENRIVVTCGYCLGMSYVTAQQLAAAHPCCPFCRHSLCFQISPHPVAESPPPPLGLQVEPRRIGSGTRPTRGKRQDSGGAAGHFVRTKIPAVPRWQDVVGALFSWSLNGDLTIRLVAIQMLFALATLTVAIVVALSRSAPLNLLFLGSLLLAQLWLAARLYREYVRHGQIVVRGMASFFPSDLVCFGYWLANALVTLLPSIPFWLVVGHWLMQLRPGETPALPSAGALFVLAIGILVVGLWNGIYFPTATNHLAVTRRWDPAAVARIVMTIPGELSIVFLAWMLVYGFVSIASGLLLGVSAPLFMGSRGLLFCMVFTWYACHIAIAQYFVVALFTANGLLLRRHAARLGLDL